MDNENRDMLEKAITEGLERLKTADSEEYSKRVNDISKLYELKIAEDKIEEDRNSKAMQRGQDSEKLDHEIALKKEETKQSILRVVGSIVEKGVTLLAYGLWIGQIMTFEQTGVIRSKAFSFIGKPKI